MTQAFDEFNHFNIIVCIEALIVGVSFNILIYFSFHNSAVYFSVYRNELKRILYNIDPCKHILSIKLRFNCYSTLYKHE